MGVTDRIIKDNPKQLNESIRAYSRRLNSINPSKSAETYRCRIKRLIRKGDLTILGLKKVTEYPNGGQSNVYGIVSDQVDTTGLQVEKVTTSPHGGQWVKYRQDDVNLDKLMKSIFNDLKAKEPFTPSSNEIKVESGNCAIVNLYDAHLDKIAVKPLYKKTGTVEQNAKRYLKAVKKCVSYASEQGVTSIIFPIGNDLFHTNGMNSQTKKGTPIDYYCQPEEAYKVIVNTIIEAVDICLSIGKVHIPFVRGNHDRDKVAILGFWLDKIYGNNKNYTSETTALQRSYVSFGKWFFGFAHGDKAKSSIAQMPLLMHQEKPMEAAKAKRRKFYLGDQHHQFEFNFLKSKDYPGTSVEFLRSVGLDDEYHTINGWVGIPKTAYVDIYSKKNTNVIRASFDL